MTDYDSVHHFLKLLFIPTLAWALNVLPQPHILESQVHSNAIWKIIFVVVVLEMHVIFDVRWGIEIPSCWRVIFTDVALEELRKEPITLL
jgi:hypothetical protein